MKQHNAGIIELNLHCGIIKVLMSSHRSLWAAKPQRSV